MSNYSLKNVRDNINQEPPPFVKKMAFAIVMVALYDIAGDRLMSWAWTVVVFICLYYGLARNYGESKES